jgi:hypothetical protein
MVTDGNRSVPKTTDTPAPPQIPMTKQDHLPETALDSQASPATPPFMSGLAASPGLPAPLPAPASPAGDSAPTPFPALQFSALPLQAVQKPRPGKPRNGKIAHLPKVQREMVSRMLANNVPHAKIADALTEWGITVTPRNISNWKTRGGYDEWRAAQAQALELRTFQDNLTAFLRRHDAAELPEVGLQSAATSISAVLLRPEFARELLSSPEKYSKLLDLQCRLARELRALQGTRDDAAKSLGLRYNPERIKREEEKEVEQARECYSGDPGDRPGAAIPHRNFIPKDIEPITLRTDRDPFGP